MILSLQRIQHTNSIGIIGNSKTGTGERKGRQAMYIELKNINKSFGDFQASKDVNFAIEKGKLVGLLGPVSYTHLSPDLLLPCGCVNG